MEATQYLWIIKMSGILFLQQILIEPVLCLELH